MYVCHVLIDQEPDNVQVQLPSQKLIHSKIARHQVLIKVTTWPVYLGELFVSEQEGVSTIQVALHQSQDVVLLSSHCSDHSNILFQQTNHVAANIVTEVVHVFLTVPDRWFLTTTVQV